MVRLSAWPWKRPKDDVVIDFRLLPIRVPGEKIIDKGFFAKQRGFAISPPFKKVDDIKKLYPGAKLTKKAQEEVKLSDLFAEVA